MSMLNINLSHSIPFKDFYVPDNVIIRVFPKASRPIGLSI